jgi:hypothetical protein
MKAAAVIFVLVTAGRAQTVIAPWQVPCSEETVRPNFELKVRQRVFGELKDQTDAPFRDSRVLLRKQDGKGRFVEYRTVSTDKTGRFDFKLVEPGKYRFLPVPNRGFKQPQEAKCGDSGDCEINLVLEVSATDQEFGGCPIR